MRILITIITLLLMLFLLSCSGEDDDGRDTTSPFAPRLIRHLGNTGDAPVIYDGFPVVLNDDNNGIDAVPEGQWIRVSWKPFVDNDLSHVVIYRYSDIDPNPLQLANIPANRSFFLDQSNLVERTWYSYFVELFDTSNNSAVSDTVSYALLAKSNLIYPMNNEIVSLTNLRLEWDLADDRAGVYRVLVWDENNTLIWSEDYPISVPEETFSVPFPNIVNPPISSGSAIRWRVDYLDWDEDRQMYMGSESLERVFYVQ